MEISKVMKQTLVNLLSQNKRLDERKLDEFRKIEINIDISKNAEGSAEVKIEKTWVIAGVKIDLVEPFQDTPESGVLIVNAEFLPLAYSEFELGPPGIDAIELARVVDRGIRESEFIKLDELCLEKGKKVYGIFIDIYILNYDGNLIDASFLAAVAALKKAFLPKLEKTGEEWKIKYGEKSKEKLPLSKAVPFMATVYKLSDKLFLDANLVEEKAADARISIAFTFGEDLFIHAVQKSGVTPLGLKELENAIQLAEKGTKFLMKKFFNMIK